MTCTPDVAQPFTCPTKWDLFRQLLALLPRGRAWQSHEEVVEFAGAPQASQVGSFEVGATGLGQEVDVERLTVLERFWAAYAEVLEYLHQRACALLEEFFCDTTMEMLPEWHVDYGFPDPCERYRHLCEKVRAIGGQTCAYIAEVAAERGWVVRCRSCGSSRARCYRAGQRRCACRHNEIVVEIDSRASPALASDVVWGRRAGQYRAGNGDVCPPADIIADVECLIERIRPAHVRTRYVVV